MSSSSFEPTPSDRLEVTSEVGASLTDFDYRIAASLLKLTHALRLPKDTIGYLVERIAIDGLQIPVSQLSGFTSFAAQSNVVGTGATETTTSTSYTNLATVGPTLTGLPDGLYVVLFGAGMKISSGTGAAMSVQVNAATAVDADGCVTESTLLVPSSRGFLATLNNAGNNTLTAKYKTYIVTETASFIRRWMIALKYQNL